MRTRRRNRRKRQRWKRRTMRKMGGVGVSQVDDLFT